MKKKNVHAILLVLFLSALLTISLTEGNTQPEEIGDLQDAMRNLKRVDNLEFSYVYKISDGEESGMQTVDVWANRLDGSWVAEYYSTDEDGTICILKQFCDGRRVYCYVDWSGEWILQERADTDVPNLEGITSLPYDSTAIKNLESTIAENGNQKITYQLTSEYLTSVSGEKLLMPAGAEESAGAGRELLNMESAWIEQYRRSRQEDVFVSYAVDAAGVLCQEAYTMVLMQPEILTNASGSVALGEEQAYEVHFGITVKRYNQDGILNKIEQCRNEMW